MRTRAALALGAAAAMVLLAGCAPASRPEPAEADGASVVASGLNSPWSVVAVGTSLLVSERDTGAIIEVLADGSTRRAGVVTDAAGSSEGGLLGLALGPTGDLYAYLTTDADNRIQRFDVTGEPGALRLGEPTSILDGVPAAAVHNGGRIAFGPDGMLYAGTGDARDAETAQNLDDLGGKILRMTADGGIPDDNPFPGSLVYSYGHRNVQGIAWADDGTMFASEFGQDTWDELNVIRPGGDYGWPTVEGVANGDDFVDPVQQWMPSTASPSGIAVVGDVLYIANLRGERLRAVPVDDPAAATEHLVGSFGRIRDVVAAPDGGLLLVTSNTDGRGNPASDDDRVIRVDLP